MKKENTKEKTNKKVNTTTGSKKSTTTVKVKKVRKEDIVSEKNTNTSVKVVATKNKSDLFLVIGLVAVVVLGFLVMGDKNKEPSYELPLTLSGEPGLHQLSYAEYQEKIDNGDHFVVILERATCPHCVTYLPVARQFAIDNNVSMYFVDTDTFSSDDWVGFEKSNSFLRKANGYWGTPTTVVLAGSEAIDYIEGATTADSLLDLYNKYFDLENKE